MKHKILITLFILANILPIKAWPGSSGAGGSPTGGGPGFNNSTNVDTPVDGGIVTVTTLAIGYGIRQARKRKEEKNNDNGAV